MLGLSSRARRAAPSLQMQPDEPLVASYDPAKTANLTMLEDGERDGVVGEQLPRARLYGQTQ